MNNVCKTVKSGLLVGLVLFLLLPLVTSVPVRASTELTMNSFDSQGNMSINGRTQSTEGGSVVPSKTKITDPTGKTEGHFLEDYSDDSFELIASRGQTSRHFYDKMTGFYKFQSDLLVQKKGILAETNWITVEEYPHRYVLRLRNGEIFFFEAASEITNFLASIDQTSVWAVGYESFDGVMGFYLNFQDETNCHGQYLYWPRLQDGNISPYDKPLYTIYPHLYAKVNNVWFDQILTDRSLYSGDFQNPRNTLKFYNTEIEFGVFFSLSQMVIQGTTWNFKHGFKYHMNDQSFHMITEMKCLDHDFDDLGLAYEITSTPQSDNTSEKYTICNETLSYTLDTLNAWSAGECLKDFYSQVSISANNDVFTFTFDDMELSGFTEKYLDLHEQQLPSGVIRKVLRAGMYGFGSYSNKSWVLIDPEVATKETTDNYDLYWYGTYTTNDNDLLCGNFGGEGYDMRFWLAFDTGLETTIDSIAFPSLELYWIYDSFDSGEGIRLYVYDIDGTGDGHTTDICMENSTSWNLGTNTNQNLVWEDESSTGYIAGDTTKVDTLLEYWADNRGSGERWLKFYAFPYGNDHYSQSDYCHVWESTKGTSYAPKLAFNYMPKDYDYWALIAAGSNKGFGWPPIYQNQYRFTRDALHMYDALLDHYNDEGEGFTNDSIYLLTHYDTLPGGTPVPRDRSMSKANFEWAINQIASFADSGDQVLIWWTGHGIVDELDMGDYFTENITATEFDYNLDKISCNEMFIYIGSCHSGSFIDDLNDTQNRAIYTSCTASQTGKAYGDDSSSLWPNATISAIDPDHNAFDADTDDPKDNRVSLLEIYEYANKTVVEILEGTGKEQGPQQWVGTIIGDDDEHYIYDGYYNHT